MNAAPALARVEPQSQAQCDARQMLVVDVRVVKTLRVAGFRLPLDEQRGFGSGSRGQDSGEAHDFIDPRCDFRLINAHVF